MSALESQLVCIHRRPTVSVRHAVLANHTSVTGNTTLVAGQGGNCLPVVATPLPIPSLSLHPTEPALCPGCTSSTQITFIPSLQAIKAAEAQLKRLTAAPALIPELLARAAGHPSAEVRQLSAVLLRKCTTKHWAKMSDTVGKDVRQPQELCGCWGTVP